MRFEIRDDHLVPVEEGQAVNRGWPAATGSKPLGVTWHWTATWDLAAARRILGGPEPERKNEASAHYGVGLSFAEGVDRWVALENRSWHAGINQTLRWDGKAKTDDAFKGARTTVGIETVNIGYARDEDRVVAGEGWLRGVSPNGMQVMEIPPWPEEQVEMMIAVGKEIVARWPEIRPEDHHGHHDLCPGYKVDVTCFPFARVLRGVYDDPDIADVWSPYWEVAGRQEALTALGYDVGNPGAHWTGRCDEALRLFQRDHGLIQDGMWTTFTSRAIHTALNP